MSQQALLKKVIQVLDRAGIKYMITGSIVSSLQGEPRSTHDIDMVIDALRVYEVQYGKLDIDYLEQWVKKLNVESLWKRLIDEAETV